MPVGGVLLGSMHTRPEDGRKHSSAMAADVAESARLGSQFGKRWRPSNRPAGSNVACGAEAVPRYRWRRRCQRGGCARRASQRWGRPRRVALSNLEARGFDARLVMSFMDGFRALSFRDVG